MADKDLILRFVHSSRHADNPMFSMFVGSLKSAHRTLLPAQPARDFVDDPLNGHADLFEAVAVPDGDCAVGLRVAVEGDAVRRADFVLPAIAAADRSLLIKIAGDAR